MRGRQRGSAIVAAAFMPAAILAALGLRLTPTWGGAVGRRPASRARILRVIDLSGPADLIDPNGRTIYLLGDGSDTSEEVLAFDWRRSRVLWRTRVVNYLGPVGITPSTLVLTYRPDEPQTWAPTAGLDLKTGRIRWQQPLESARRECLIGITVAGEFIFKALPGRLVCLKAATGRAIWARDFGSQMTRMDWPYPPAVAGGSVFAQEEVEGTRVVALSVRDGSTRWSHHYPWAVSFEGPPEVRRVGPLAVAGNAVVALIPTGPQHGAPDLTGLLPPTSALYCWDARTGKLRWRRNAPWTNEPLVVAHGVVVALLGQGHAVAFWTATGKQAWRLDDQVSDIQPAPGRYGRDILLSQSGDRELSMIAVDSATGKLRWRVGLPRATEIKAASVRTDVREVLVAAEEHPPTGPWRFRLYVISIAQRR